MSKLGYLNVIVCQWLFFRVAAVQMPDGEVLQYRVLFPILPLTGWWTSYFPRRHANLPLTPLHPPR